MKQLKIAGVTAGMLLAAAGCGRVLVSADHANYLRVSRSKVVFVQWRKTSRGDLHGTITEGSIGGGGAGPGVPVRRAACTATIPRSSARPAIAERCFSPPPAPRPPGRCGGRAAVAVSPPRPGAVAA